MLKAANQTTKPSISISYISENAVLLEWPEKVCANQHQHIIECQQKINAALTTAFIDSIVSYASLIIYYDFTRVTHNTLHNLLLDIVNAPYSPNNNLTADTTAQPIIEIPVYYGNEAGWDIKGVANTKKISIDELINSHTQTIYRAYALGFTPGFCYLGELPAKLHMQRKSSPRLTVPKGAVAIAEQQTAIYPNVSPGGWHIIGQTPVEMCHVDMTSTQDKQFTSTILVGQRVRFTAISREEFISLGGIVIKETA